MLRVVGFIAVLLGGLYLAGVTPDGLKRRIENSAERTSPAELHPDTDWGYLPQLFENGAITA